MVPKERIVCGASGGIYCSSFYHRLLVGGAWCPIRRVVYTISPEYGIHSTLHTHWAGKDFINGYYAHYRIVLLLLSGNKKR